MAEKLPVIAVTGPTATGKTSLGIGLCRYFGGEVVSCDSMQIYRGLPIGTAQPEPEELAAVPHHLIGFLDVRQAFSVSDYVNLASQTIKEVYAGRHMPVLVGGTGLYARSLLRGFSFEDKCRDEALREKLFQEAEKIGAEEMHHRLKELDPEAAKEIHPNNLKRTLRALEYCLLSGKPFSAQAERSKMAESPYFYRMLCLTFRDRQKLYDRINSRVDGMLQKGLLEEAHRFWLECRSCGTPPTAAQAIGYKELFPYFEGKVSLNEAVESIKQESRRYAKRQLTWFSREENVRFLYVDEFESFSSLLEESVRILELEGFQKRKEGSL